MSLVMVNRLLQLQPTPGNGTGVLARPRCARRRTWRQSFRCAAHGLSEAWRDEPNLRVHVYIGTAVLALGVWCRLATIEWLWVSFAIGLVIFAELMNTAIEQMVDLVVGLSPNLLARRVKDVAAGCVLVACLLAVVIGLFTFGPHLVGE